MDLNKISLFEVLKKRMNWHGQRQEVLSHNIANADTPKFKAKDLKPFKFREMIRRDATQLNMNVSQPDHLVGKRKRTRDFAEQTERRPFETSPDGNSVILEEQVSKLNENQIGFKLSAELYKKHLNMIRIALAKR